MTWNSHLRVESSPAEAFGAAKTALSQNRSRQSFLAASWMLPWQLRGAFLLEHFFLLPHFLVSISEQSVVSSTAHANFSMKVCGTKMSNASLANFLLTQLQNENMGVAENEWSKLLFSALTDSKFNIHNWDTLGIWYSIKVCASCEYSQRNWHDFVVNVNIISCPMRGHTYIRPKLRRKMRYEVHFPVMAADSKSPVGPRSWS